MEIQFVPHVGQAASHCYVDAKSRNRKLWEIVFHIDTLIICLSFVTFFVDITIILHDHQNALRMLMFSSPPLSLPLCLSFCFSHSPSPLLSPSVSPSRPHRIKKSGGFITWNSLGQPNVNGRLAMTRSIGDFDLKNMGVIAEPETKKMSVSPARFRMLNYFKLRALLFLTRDLLPLRINV